jgi:DNA-binding transcriptional MocR family regulator
LILEIYRTVFNEEITKYMQIARHIKKLIDKGVIRDGEKLPSIRKLASFLSVNNDTIINTYKKLQDEGYALQKMGSGTYAKKKEDNRRLKKDYNDTFKKIRGETSNGYIDFAGETSCNVFFPIGNFKEVINEVIDRDGVDALIYQETLGFEGLRKSISKYFWNSNLEIEDVLIVSGAQQGIDIISKSIINVNDNVIVEKPTYNGALFVFKWRGANIFEIDMENDGINLGKFKQILKKNRIKCFYTMSYFQNPTGMTYSREKKKEILKLAKKYDFYIVEDDYLSELIYNTNIKYESFRSLDKNDRVIYIKSFSKIFLPGIRLGYLISPREIREQIESSKVNTDISTSSLMQRALDLYIIKGYWKEYINKLREIYIKRYVYMESCIYDILKDKVSFESPGGGFNFYLKINSNISINSDKLFYECKRNKVLISPGVLFYRNKDDGLKFFRLGYSQTDEIEMKKGIEIIDKILRKYEYK